MASKRMIFWKLFFSYIILLIIALCVISLIYYMSTESMQKTLYEQSQTTLLGIKDTIGTLMSNVENYAVTILFDEDINSFLSLKNIGPRSAAISDIYRFTKTLGKYQLTDSLIRDIYILADANEFVLFSSNAVRYTELYHESLFGFTGMDFQAMNTFLHDPDLKNGYYLFSGSPETVTGEIVYIRKIPYSISSGGILILRVNTESILTLLQPACVVDNSLAFILNGDDKIIALCSNGNLPDMSIDKLLADYRSGGMEAILSDQYNITRSVSEEGWQYFSIIPRETVLYEVYTARKQIIIITFALVLVGIAISYLLTRNKARSLGNMVTSLSSELMLNKKGRNEYVVIEDAVTRLINDRSSFWTLSENQRMLIRDELVRRLLLEDYLSLDELNGLMAATGSMWTNCKYAVITVVCPAQGSMDRFAGIVRLFSDYLLKRCQEPFHILLIDKKHYVMLFLPKPSWTDKKWREFSDETAKAMKQCLHQQSVQVIFCISGLYDQLADVHQAYDETVVMTEYAKTLQQERAIFRFNDLTYSDEFYYYPMDVELKLVQLVKTGNTQELDKLLHMIYTENFEKRVLSMAMIRQLVFVMRGTIVRCLRTIAPNNQTNERMQELSRETTIQGIFNYVVKISKEICEMIKERNQHEKFQIKQAILDTIERKYPDSNFSIHQLSDNLHMTEKALYNFIHDHFEQTFWEMVENVRIQKACELMRDDILHINDIANRVGYNSDQSFRRAFKRIMKIVPSMYAKSIQ